MGSDWDNPGKSAAASTRRDAPVKSANGWNNGLFDPLAVLGWAMGNALRIALITIVLTIIGVGAVLMLNFPYSATAVVLADPREQRITLQEEVLPSIGTDAAVLESMVQIVRSDGFLLQAMRDLKVFGETPASQEEELKQLAKFRKDITVDRKGATYLVDVTYRADNPAEAARVANGIAAAFADSQNGLRNDATTAATRALSQQLVEARARLNASEEAVAQFKAANGIVYVDERNTVQMRQLAELNQQLALVRNATEEARARYEERNSGGALTQGPNERERGQLSFLRQQQAQLIQQRDQQAQVYGPRHPRLAQTNEAIAGIQRQIAQEERLQGQQLKAELDVALAKQAQIESKIAELSSNVTQTDTHNVELEALEREAAANRDQYQQLLSRNRATDQLAMLPTNNVRVVSSAVPPLRSTRPSLALLVPVIGFLSFAAASALTIAGSLRNLRRKPRRTIDPTAPLEPVAEGDDWPEDPPPGTAQVQAPEPARQSRLRGSLLALRERDRIERENRLVAHGDAPRGGTLLRRRAG